MIIRLIENYELIIVAALGIQIPVITLLFFLTKEVTSFDKRKYTDLISYAWIFNLLIVLLKILSQKYNIFHSSFLYFDHISRVLNLLMSYTFLVIGLISFGFHKYLYVKYHITRIIYFLGFLIIFVFHYKYPGNFYLALLYSSANAVSLIILASYYYKQSSQNGLFITLGLGLYIVCQYISVFSCDLFKMFAGNNIKLIDLTGWTISSLAKAILLVGLYKIVLSRVNERFRIDVYEKILNLSLHESISEIKFSYNKIEDNILPSIDKENREVEFNRREVANELNEVNYAIKRIEYIHLAAEKLFESVAYDLDYEKDIELRDLLTKPEYKDVHTININKVIEYCYLLRKRTRDKSDYNIKYQYGGNCFVRFNEESLQQVLINILKNAEEAYRKIDNNIVIYVKTSVIKRVSQIANDERYAPLRNDIIDGKTFVKVEIEDDGIGTSLKLNQISEYGVSEKSTNSSNGNKGIGMFVITHFIKLFDGYTFFESPPTNSLIDPSKKLSRGSKVILYIPRPEKRKI